MNKHPLDSFIEFLQTKNPDVCIHCFGQGKGEFRGNFMQFPMTCPVCKGTGKKPKVEIKTEIYYSECCYATMPNYPDNNFCPKCGEHACGYTQEEIDREEGEDGRLLK